MKAMTFGKAATNMSPLESMERLSIGMPMLISWILWRVLLDRMAKTKTLPLTLFAT